MNKDEKRIESYTKEGRGKSKPTYKCDNCGCMRFTPCTCMRKVTK